MMEFRAHLPSDCPPSSTESTSGEVDRFIDMNHSTPLPEDFLSLRELNPDKPCPKGATECQYCGVSVYRSIDDVRRVPKRIPAFKKKKLALGNLTSNLGLIQNTPSKTGKSHHT
ncbi:hypothetical protein [Synechocystis sp. PCC 7509]|uniref:hypothetical protein n=1 Tax=Synechocystis sp. PCC 7509 TaxID=927677 RepID=UPI0002AC19DA|nr:hypothetical protein [Synechocystis sp. PCC 7509]